MKRYVTFTRKIRGYKWYKPLLVLLLTVLFQICATIVLSIIYYAIKLMKGEDIMSAMQTIIGGYDSMDVYSVEGALFMLGNVASFIPAIWLSSLIVKDRPFSSYGGVGGFDIKLFAKYLLIALFPVGIPVALSVVLEGKYTGDIKFTAMGLITCVVLTMFQCMAEEYFFRGLIMQTVGAWSKNVIIAIIVQAIIFASVHSYNIYGVIEVLLAGILLGIIAHVTDGIEASSAAHFMNNIAIFLLNGLGYETIRSEVEFASIIESTLIDAAYLAIVFFLIKKGKLKRKPMPKPVDAVIFDLDGTLTDTEKFYQVAWPQALEHFGYKCEPWMPLELRSLGRPFAPLKFKEWFGQDFDYDQVREYRKGLVVNMIKEQGIPLKPGVKEILVWLRENGVLTAIATANDYERTKGYLTELGIFDLFDRIICSDMVKEGKPAPDIYCYACQQLQLSPDRTFAVEDSPNGVTSAFLAGCKVVMVPDLTPPDAETAKKLYATCENLLGIKDLF